jgi:hypothetical protein
VVADREFISTCGVLMFRAEADLFVEAIPDIESMSFSNMVETLDQAKR